MAWQFSCARKWAHSPHPHSSRGFLAFRRPVIARARKPSAARATFDVLLHYSKQNARNSPWNKFLITIYQVTCLNSSAVSYLDRNATLVSDTTIEIRNIRDLVFIRAGPGNNKRFLDDHFYLFSSVEVSFDFSLHLFLPAFHFLSLSVQQSSLGLNRPEEIQNGVLQKLGGNIFTAINKTDKDSDMYELFQR